MAEERGYDGSSLFLSFLLGGVIGAGIALLTAPKSGRELRSRIREFAEDTKERAADYVDQTREGFTSAMEKGRTFYEDKRSALSNAVEAGKQAFTREKDKQLSKDGNA